LRRDGNVATKAWTPDPSVHSLTVLRLDLGQEGSRIDGTAGRAGGEELARRSGSVALWETRVFRAPDDGDREVVRLATRSTPAQDWERGAAGGALVLGGLIALGVLAVGIGLAVQASGVFGLPIPRVEGAARGSYLLWRQSILETIPTWLEPLKFLAPASLLTAIALTLSRILKTLRLRADTTERSLPVLLARGGR
jgi:hypothetical protein